MLVPGIRPRPLGHRPCRVLNYMLQGLHYCKPRRGWLHPKPWEVRGFGFLASGSIQVGFPVQSSGPSIEPCLSWPLILRTQCRCPFLELSWVCLLRVTTFHSLKVPVFCDHFAVCLFGYPPAHRGRGYISPTLSLLLEWSY